MADLRKLKDKAAELAAKGKLDKAAELYREAVRGDPKDVATHQKLAEVLRRAGRTRDAVEAYRAVADRFAHDGLLIKAIAISKTILELDPEHVETQAVLADLYAKRAAAEGARPPARTVMMMAAVRPSPPSAGADDGVVAIPLAPPGRPAAVELPEEEAVPLEELVERPPERSTAPPRRAQTDFARIVFAADAAVRAGLEGEVIEAEPIEEVLEVDVPGDEPLEGTAPPPPAPVAARTAGPPGSPAAAALPRVPIFSDLSRDAFVALTTGMVLARVNGGDAVIREGDLGTSFYVVANGKLAVSKRDERGEAVVLARLGEGDFFGEMALLSGAPRAATVIAEERSELLEFRAEVLLAIAGKHPQLAASLRRFYRQRLLANAMAVSPLFRPFAKGDRKLIMERFRSRAVAEGEIVVREGEPSDGLYVVLDGVVDVVKRGSGAEVTVGQLREGDLFGEMSCLRKAPASASVVVRRGGTLLRLPRRDFDELVVTYPQILELVADLSEERAENLDAILSGHAQWTEDGLVLV
ncbi:MAG TPA: cyclic nucleotide-binding domain-containing protein [Anaeromyxobacter sp.]